MLEQCLAVFCLGIFATPEGSGKPREEIICVRHWREAGWPKVAGWLLHDGGG